MSKPNMIKRADGSYSKHGLWDSIRENKGSGKAPTKEMLKQEKKIKSEYGDGGTIHIKPENKGKFNATKKATGKTTEELTHSKNPVTKKRAIFAQNAAKWKHAEGGEIEKLGTDNTNVNIPKKDLTISRFKTGSKNYNEIPEAFRNLPLQTGKVDDASLDAVQALTGIGALARAGKIGYGAYQLSKPNIINLSKTYRPTYNNALRQAGQALLPFAAGGVTEDPKNTFGLTGNYSRTPNPEAIESNYKLAADYQRRLGNFNAGLNANLGFDHNLPLNTEQFNGSPTIIPNANLGLNVDYDRNNNNFSGSFNYNPINQGINAEVTYKKRFADGGKTVINPIITKPITTLQDNTVNNFPQIKQKTDSSFNSNKDSLGQFFDLVGLRPTSYQSKTPIPFTQTSPKISKNISVDPEIENRNKQISVLQNEIKAAEQSYYKQKKEYDNFMNSSKKEPIPVPAPMPISIPEEITPTPRYRGPHGNAEMDENWVLDAYAKGGRILPKYLVGGFNVGLGNKSSNLFTKNYAATPAGFGQTPATTSSNTTNAPQTNTTNAKTRNNNAAVGAGLGFAGDTTNLLFDNNVFGTRNEVTDSEGNVLGEAQSDAGSQTQGALSGALKGASAGAALGPWGMAGGALIGGVAGFLTADTGAEDKLNQIKRERNAQISFKNMLGKGPIENNSIQTNSQSLYANGGMKTLNQNHPEATEEVELGESAMLPNGMNLAFGGETHENGGLETNLPEGTRIFSDRIKSGKRTIASIAKPIQNKIEKLKDNNSKAGQNTIKLFENQLDNLFNEQEEIKQQQDMAQQRKYFAKGGLIKYDRGGEDDIFSNPNKYVNKLPDSSPVRIGNENTVSTDYQKIPYQFDKDLAIAKKTTPIEKIEPVKKAMINNAPKAQSFQPLAADAQAMYEEKKKNPAWKNFKGNYSIYSKENSMLHLFDNEHNLIDQTRAGRGVGKGDTPNLADAKNFYDSSKPKKGQEAAIKAATTPAGAYAIQEGPVEKDYATKVYRFNKPNKNNVQPAMHGIYKGDAYNRTKIINDPNIKQAFVSNGCLNIPAPFLNKYDNQINTGDSLFITKEPKFDRGGTTEEDLPYSKKRQYMLDYLQGKYQTGNQKEDAVINYRNNQNVERQQVNDELGAQLDAENGNIVNPYNQNINTIQPRSINNLKVNNTFNQPNNINSSNFKTKTINPLMTATDYQPGSYGFATDPVLNLNQPVIKPNYVPANSDQADYENSLKEQNSLHNYLGMTQDDMMKMVNNRSLTKTPEGYYYMNNNVPNGGKGDFDKNLNQPGDIPPPSEPRFNKGDIGTAGALGTSLLGNLIQRSNLNKVAPPRTLVAPTFTAGRTPVKADYSADLQSADNQFNAARRGVMMNSGNYSTQAGNLGQLRAEQLRNRSKILQNQNNANAVLMNEYQKAQADAINKNALSNYTTDQENMENLYNYNLWKTGQTNAADASAFNTSGQMFNNMVTGQNQLDAAEMYRRMYAQKVRDDLAFKAMGGTIKKRTIKKK